MKDSAAGIVEEGLQPGSLGLGALGSDNIAVVKESKIVRFKEEKSLKKKPRETAKKLSLQDTLAQTMLMWSDHVNVIDGG